MSSYHQQFYLDVPVNSVWHLVGDPRRHVEWWPQAIEVRGERFAEGDEFIQVSRAPLGMRQTTPHMVERLEDLREVRLTCQKTGRYTHWTLTEARGGTFVDAEMGFEPTSLGMRLFEQTAGKYYLRRWLAQAVDGLRAAASTDRPVPPSH